MAKPHKFYNHIPETLPFEVYRLEPEDRLSLGSAMLASIVRSRPELPGDVMLDTTERGIAHFEVVTSAIRAGFISEYHETFDINGYELMIFYPAKATE